MRPALHAEWTKLRTTAGPGWLLLGAVAVTVAASATASAAVRCQAAGCGQDAGRVSLAGVTVGQALVALLAVLVVCGEYSTGMIRTTLAAVPRRSVALAAKAAVVGGTVLVAGTVAVLGSVLAGRYLLPGSGFTAAHGYSRLSLADGPMLRAAGGSVLYLVLIALLSLGAAAALRDSAAAISVVLGLLYLFPILSAVVSDPHWQRHVRQVSPMNAGLTIQSTTHLHHPPVGPWTGLGVLAAWAAVALLGGALLLHRRDA